MRSIPICSSDTAHTHTPLYYYSISLSILYLLYKNIFSLYTLHTYLLTLSISLQHILLSIINLLLPIPIYIFFPVHGRHFRGMTIHLGLFLISWEKVEKTSGSIPIPNLRIWDIAQMNTTALRTAVRYLGFSYWKGLRRRARAPLTYLPAIPALPPVSVLATLRLLYYLPLPSPSAALLPFHLLATSLRARAAAVNLLWRHYYPVVATTACFVQYHHYQASLVLPAFLPAACFLHCLVRVAHAFLLFHSQPASVNGLLCCARAVLSA